MKPTWHLLKQIARHRRIFINDQVARDAKWLTWVDFQLACKNAENIGFVAALRRLVTPKATANQFGNGTGTAQTAYVIAVAYDGETPQRET
jgi:hypothetical protein